MANVIFFLIFKIIYLFTYLLFIYFKKYLFMREREREKQALCREPDAGLDPRTPGSRPEPKADAQPLNHPGIPVYGDFYCHLVF